MERSTRKTPEMSVEEILKSIRGIINEHKNDGDEEEVLELTDIISEEKQSPTMPLSKNEEDFLINERIAAETASSFKNFAEKAKFATYETRKEKNLTIEELVAVMIKPLLKEWLNTNLPILVKNLVEKEIKRLIPDDE